MRYRGEGVERVLSGKLNLVSAQPGLEEDTGNEAERLGVERAGAGGAAPEEAELRVSAQAATDGRAELGKSRFPVATCRRSKVDGAGSQISGCLHNIFLVAEVPVGSRDVHPESIGDLPHGYGLDPALAHQVEGDLRDLGPG